MTNEDAKSVVIACVMKHLGMAKREAEVWLWQMGETYTNEAVKRVHDGATTPERLFDVKHKWRLMP